jgi:UDP-N-acetylmuramoyl-L-alanyl-D-glutamate--2,6-diaminopimelate ligase
LTLHDLLQGIEPVRITGEISLEITGIHYDSRKIEPGFLFVCISGLKTDGHLYIKEAVKNGAAAVITEKEVPIIEGIAFVQVSDSRQAMPVIAANFFKHPSKELRVIGVTGTNGKTTVTHLIKAILEARGEKTAIIGTLYAKVGDQQKEFGHTTPESLEIQEFIRLSLDEGSRYVVMEVSSHALELHRVDSVDFDAAVFTNLTQDHLDYHLDMESYKNAKLKLFTRMKGYEKKFSIINADDKWAEFFIAEAGENCITYGIHNSADVQAYNIKTSLKGSSFTVKYRGSSWQVKIKLMGMFSIYNALSAIAFALREQIPPDIIVNALGKVSGVPGRFETIDCGQNFTVVVDYAHTPDGLENILTTGKEIVENRLITVFGCGGDRDRTKRPLMGEIAARLSDFCVVTSDNPRSEEPEAIIAEIVQGLEKVDTCRYAIIPDRREAIRHAIFLARKGDLVIIAGKGHETYQLVKGKVLDFDDRKIAAQFIKEKIGTDEA